MNVLARLAQRFELLPARQRTSAFAAAAVVVAAASFLTFSLPLLQSKWQLIDANRLKEAQKSKLEAQMAEATGANASDIDAGNKQRIESLKRLIAEAEAGLAAKRDRLVPPERMPKLIEEVIARVPDVQLVELRSMPAVALFEGDASKKGDDGRARGRDSGADAQSPAVRDPAIFRHGVIVEVRGGYLELLAYVRALESLPLQVFWNDVSVRADDASGKALMRLSLFTLSVEKTWLKV